MIDRGVRSWALRLATSVGLVGVLALAPVAAASPRGSVAAGPGRAVAAELAPWTGGINLYRDGVFTTQASWLYCTAADVQIIKNMAEGASDHSSAAQTAYFDWMRTQNQYDLPLSAGVDPTGWATGMQHFVDPRYALVSTQSFGYGLQLAVTRMRRTGLPVAITVAHGNHGWVLNGFTATADPAVTTDFEISSVSVTGPLWGLQSKNGYDMPPNTTLTLDELRTFFTRWHYDPIPMIWDGTFVSIQPLADGETPATQSTPLPPTPEPTPRPTPGQTRAPTAPPPPTPVATATTTVLASLAPVASPTSPMSARTSPAMPGPRDPADPNPPGPVQLDAGPTSSSTAWPGILAVAIVVAGAAVALLAAVRYRDERRPR